MKEILNSYYRFIKTTGKSRFDCEASTGDYEHFKTILTNKIKFNIGGLSLNLGDVPECFNNNRHRATQAITRGDNISKLFLFDIGNPTVFYGDAKDTNDVLIMVVENNTLEVFISKGNKNIQLDVCSEFINGSLEEEIQALKERAIKHEIK